MWKTVLGIGCLVAAGVAIFAGVVWQLSLPSEIAYGDTESYAMGALPSDICVVDGKAMIEAISYDDDGFGYIVYWRDNGDLVSGKFDKARDGYIISEQYWTGGTCPDGG